MRRYLWFQYLSSLAFYLICGLAAIIWCLVCLSAYQLSDSRRRTLTLIWNRFCLKMLDWICGIRIRTNLDRSRSYKSCVFASNHQSALETLALPVLLPDLTLVLRSSLLSIPFFGWGLAGLKPIVIDRSATLSSMFGLVRRGVQVLKTGQNILIYPEGTRRPPGLPGPYAPGAAALALKADAPLIPIAHNSGQVWPKKRFLKTPGLVFFDIGEELIPQASVRLTNQKLREYITEQQARLIR